MLRPSHRPARARTHAATALLLGLLLVAVAPSVDSADRRPAEAVCDPGALTLHVRFDGHGLGRGGPGGGIAQLRLEVAGTESPVRVELINRTPGVIGLEGGEIQVSLSTGGADNHLERAVSTYRSGEFQIRYRLADPPCPAG